MVIGRETHRQAYHLRRVTLAREMVDWLRVEWAG
jgi:hypothetical protein